MTPDIKYRKQAFLYNLNALQKATKTEKPKNSETDENPTEKWYQNYGKVTARYLQEVYSINTIKGFAYKVNTANAHTYSTERRGQISFRTLDSIVESCEKWRPYLLNQESFDLLVCLEVLSMAKIHASVISMRQFAEHQGSQGVCLKEGVEVPYLFATVVSYYGLLQTFS